MAKSIVIGALLLLEGGLGKSMGSTKIREENSNLGRWVVERILR